MVPLIFGCENAERCETIPSGSERDCRVFPGPGAIYPPKSRQYCMQLQYTPCTLTFRRHLFRGAVTWRTLWGSPGIPACRYQGKGAEGAARQEPQGRATVKAACAACVTARDCHSPKTSQTLALLSCCTAQFLGRGIAIF